MMLLGIRKRRFERLGDLAFDGPGVFAGVFDVLVVEALGESDEVSLRAATIVGLHVCLILSVASGVELERGQATDLEALGNAAVRVGVDDGKADVAAHFFGGGNPIRARQVAVIAPRSCEHNHPNFVAAFDDVVEVVVRQVDDFAVHVVLTQVRVGNVLQAVLGCAEIVH